jgi:hypothetical protein
MFIIWGWRAVKALLGTGTFYCPRCQGDRCYRHFAARRWFTLFFIPMIPLKALGSYVECDVCHGTFVEPVLEAPTVAQFEHALGLATRAAAAHLVSRLSPTADVVSQGVAALADRAGVAQPYDENRLRADVAAFADQQTALHYLAPLATTMSIDGREDFVRRLVVLGAQLAPADRMNEPIAAMASELQLSAAHLAGIREQVQAWSQTGGPA